MKILSSFSLAVVLGVILNAFQGSSNTRWRVIEVGSDKSEFPAIVEQIAGENVQLLGLRRGVAQFAVDEEVDFEALVETTREFNVSLEILTHDALRTIKKRHHIKERSITPHNFDKYMPPDEMQEYILNLQDANSGFLKRRLVGKSYEGRDIYMFTISSGPLTKKSCRSDRHNRASSSYRWKRVKRDLPSVNRKIKGRYYKKSKLYSIISKNKLRISKKCEKLSNKELEKMNKDKIDRCKNFENFKNKKNNSKLKNEIDISPNFEKLPKTTTNPLFSRNSKINPGFKTRGNKTDYPVYIDPQFNPKIKKEQKNNPQNFEKSRNGKNPIPTEPPIHRISKRNVNSLSFLHPGFKTSGNKTHYFLYTNPQFNPKIKKEPTNNFQNFEKSRNGKNPVPTESPIHRISKRNVNSLSFLHPGFKISGNKTHYFLYIDPQFNPKIKNEPKNNSENFEKSRNGKNPIPTEPPIHRISKRNVNSLSFLHPGFKISGNKTHYFLYFDPKFLPAKGKTLKRIKSKKTEKPIIFIDAGIHAREWISPAVALYFIDKVRQDEEMLSLVDWMVLPMANPDGYQYSWDVDRFWRKTRSGSRHSHCVGVDLNRNFDIKWGAQDTSRNACEEHYGGRNASSEAETKIIEKIIGENQRRIKAYVSLHNWGQDILYPYTYTEYEKAPTSNELERVAKGMSEAITGSGGVLYKYGQGSKILYPASGVSTDWAYEKMGIPYSFLVELRDNDGLSGFLLPESFIRPTGEDLYAAMKYLAEEINTKFTKSCD